FPYPFILCISKTIHYFHPTFILLISSATLYLQLDLSEDDTAYVIYHSDDGHWVFGLSKAQECLLLQLFSALLLDLDFNKAPRSLNNDSCLNIISALLLMRVQLMLLRLMAAQHYYVENTQINHHDVSFGKMFGKKSIRSTVGHLDPL
ncbi:hypothetical protein M8C21_015651, partial [Ambrosia artemisiifolia]